MNIVVCQERSRRRGFRPSRHTRGAFVLLFFFEFIKRQPLMQPKFPHNRPFHGVFQLLTWTSSGKSVHTTEKSALKLEKVPSLKVICGKLMKIQLFKAAKFYRRLYGGGGGGRKNLPPPLPLPIHTSVNFRDFTELYLRSLKTNHFQIWQFHCF